MRPYTHPDNAAEPGPPDRAPRVGSTLRGSQGWTEGRRALIYVVSDRW